tara:strand:+ start:7016 stop:7216 length:201 start_codon:yes stop_codon:yes gene_type:complete
MLKVLGNNTMDYHKNNTEKINKIKELLNSSRMYNLEEWDEIDFLEDMGGCSRLLIQLNNILDGKDL